MAEITLEEYHLYSPYYVDSEARIPASFKYADFFKKLNNLPENIGNFFREDVRIAEFVKTVIDQNNLNEYHGQEIARIIRDLLFNDIYLGDIINQIKERLKIDDQKAKTIAALIVTDLFGPILEDLKKRHIEKFAREIRKQQLIQPKGPEIPKPPPPQKETTDEIINLKNL